MLFSATPLKRAFPSTSSAKTSTSFESDISWTTSVKRKVVSLSGESGYGVAEDRTATGAPQLITSPPPSPPSPALPRRRSEKSSSVYSTDLITKILKEEGSDLFDARSASLGHTLQGGVPSPLDRARATRLSQKCMQFLESHATPHSHSYTRRATEADPASAAIITIQGSQIVFATVDEVMKATDMKNRRGKRTWWRDLKALAEMMGGRAGLVDGE